MTKSKSMNSPAKEVFIVAIIGGLIIMWLQKKGRSQFLNEPIDAVASILEMG